MGRTPCCTKMGLNRGPWTPEEDNLLSDYIKKHGEGKWRTLPKKAGLLRCGKSCRLRWMNYLRPDVKRGQILPDEEDLILKLHRLLGNRWSLIAGRIPGRTDNEIKNYWNTHLSRKLISQGIDPRNHKPLAESELDNHSPDEGNNKVDSENELNPSSDSQYKYPETATVDDNIETSKVVEDTELPETPVEGSLRDFTDINASNTITAPVFKDTTCKQDSSNAVNIARKLIPYCNASSELSVKDHDDHASLYLRRNSITNRYFMAPAITDSGLDNIPGFPDSTTENPTNEGHSLNFEQFDMQQRQIAQGIRMDVSPISTGATSEDYNSDIFSDFLESFMGEDQLREEANKHVGSSENRQQFLHTEAPVHLGYNMWSILSPPSQLPYSFR